LRITDVHALQEVSGFNGQDIWFHLNHPIKWVRLTGVIVAVDQFDNRMVLTLDDSSGLNIEATCTAPPRESILLPQIQENTTKASERPTAQVLTQLISPDGPNLTNIDVGAVVKMKGGINIWRDQKQIRLKAITLIKDTNDEVKCWNDALAFKKDIISKPWVVSAEEEERCHKEAMIEDQWKRRTVKGKEVEREIRKEDKEAAYVEKRKKRKAEESGATEKQKKRKDEKNGLDPANRANYPSKAARLRAAGKFDTLGF